MPGSNSVFSFTVTLDLSKVEPDKRDAYIAESARSLEAYLRQAVAEKLLLLGLPMPADITVSPELAQPVGLLDSFDHDSDCPACLRNLPHSRQEHMQALRRNWAASQPDEESPIWDRE
ncbi:MAG: hypothetical protein KJ077_11250 [Anaerolineae bacterium]|nr:hypothetical protein [Anaerolineae bacterium]